VRPASAAVNTDGVIRVPPIVPPLLAKRHIVVQVPHVLVQAVVAVVVLPPQRTLGPFLLPSRRSTSVVQVRAVFHALVLVPEDFITAAALAMVTVGLKMGSKLNPTTVVPVVSLATVLVTNARFQPLLQHRTALLRLRRIVVPS